jgi:hypothetical protein
LYSAHEYSDFGLAQRVTPNIIGHLPTWRWAAPETFDPNVKFYDERADIYSFGMGLGRQSKDMENTKSGLLRLW